MAGLGDLISLAVHIGMVCAMIGLPLAALAAGVYIVASAVRNPRCQTCGGEMWAYHEPMRTAGSLVRKLAIGAVTGSVSLRPPRPTHWRCASCGGLRPYGGMRDYAPCGCLLIMISVVSALPVYGALVWIFASAG